MKCEEFWEKAASFLTKDKKDTDSMPDSLKEHLLQCTRCRKEWNVMEQGFCQLKKEVEEEMDSLFWLKMRNHIQAELPSQNTPRRFWNTIFTPTSAWAGAAAISMLALFLVFGIYHNRKEPLSGQDLVAIFDPSAYTTSLPDPITPGILLGDEGEGETEEPSIMAGLVEPWSGVLDEIDGQDVSQASHQDKKSEKIPQHKRATVLEKTLTV